MSGEQRDALRETRGDGATIRYSEKSMGRGDGRGQLHGGTIEARMDALKLQQKLIDVTLYPAPALRIPNPDMTELYETLYTTNRVIADLRGQAHFSPTGL